MSDDKDDKLPVVNKPPEPERPEKPERPASSDVSVPGVGVIEPGTLKASVVEALKTVHDPEIPVNIYELGLIYELSISEEKKVDVLMTLTAPGCPVAPQIVADVKAKVGAVEDVKEVEVELTWDPAWNPDMMSDAAKLQLNMF